MKIIPVSVIPYTGREHKQNTLIRSKYSMKALFMIAYMRVSCMANQLFSLMTLDGISYFTSTATTWKPSEILLGVINVKGMKDRNNRRKRREYEMNLPR
jgi:hypothetical protein